MGVMNSHHDIYNAHIEKIRHSEYPQLLGTTYLDHAGTTLYARSLIDAYHRDLMNNLYGNPHSVSPASDLSTRKVEEARLAVLNYFHADPDQFDVVFTANATAAIKLVADCFRDQDFDYIYHKDVHTSVVGVRELSASKSECLATNEQVENWIKLQESRSPTRLQLFAFPAQSNLNGYRPPYSWCRSIRDACRSPDSGQTTYALLDAASYLTSGRLDLSCADDAPDFIALSFYKIFGFPDLGALLVKKTAFDVMTHRRYFGGGTVDTVTVLGGTFHGSKQQSLHDFLEDGTLPFHNILALNHAIAVYEKIYGSFRNISQHVAHLIAWLHDELEALKHFNDTPVVDIYQDPLAIYGVASTQGPIIAFNILKSDGSLVGKSHLERLAINCGFQLRTGGVCNPGGIATMLDLSHWELMRNFTEGVRCGGDVDVVGAKPTGICRISLGPMSTMSDVVRFSEFIKYFFVEETDRARSTAEEPIMNTGVVNCITPIDGCSGFPVCDDDFAAYCIWDKQWCIVDSTTGNLLHAREALASLTVNIDVRSEKLRLIHISGKEIAIDLWEVPRSSDDVDQKSNEQPFNLYQNKEIDSWLSTHLGSPCTLGRYRHEKFSQTKEATTCVASDCGVNFGSKEMMGEHYTVHAQEFMKTHPFGTTDGSQAPTTLEKWRQRLRRQSVQQPKQSAPAITSKHSASTVLTGTDGESTYPKSQLSPTVSTDKVTSVTSRPSSPYLKDSTPKTGQVEGKARTKDHRFSIIITKVTGKG